MFPLQSHWSWIERGFALRDRLLSSTRFQRLAGAFPLTRPIARRRARQLFDLCAGFVYSQVLLACVRLRLFDILAEGPQTLDTLAKRLSLPMPTATRLLEAAASLDLAARRSGNRFGLGSVGATMVGNRAVAEMVEHHALLYEDLRDPVALLRATGAQTRLASYWPYADADTPNALPAERVAAYTCLMAASQPLVAAEVLDAYSFAAHRCLLDVGGGDGSFLLAAGARAPQLQLKLFELPAVAEKARAAFSAQRLSQRAEVFGGDFLRERLPEGADIASLVRVLLDHDDTGALALLRAVRRALPHRGVLLIAEPMREAPGAQRMGAAYFGFYLLAMGRGRPRTPADIQILLDQSGFGRLRMIPTRVPLQTCVAVARAV